MNNLQECIKWLKDGAYKKVCLQIPDDLIIQSFEIALHLQKQLNIHTYVISNTAYENCCTDKLSNEHTEADAYIHFGHSCFSYLNDLPTFHVLPKQSIDIDMFCQVFYNYFSKTDTYILLLYDVSFTHLIDHIYKKLNVKYKNIVVSTLNCISDSSFTSFSRNQYQYTISGRYCKLPEKHQLDNYDAIFLGFQNKTFLTLSQSMPVRAWHYYYGSQFHTYDIFSSSLYKRRNFIVEKIRDAHTFGILITSQNFLDSLTVTEMLKRILKSVNKKSYLLNVGKITPTKLANFPEIDVFVIVACSESSLHQSRDYYQTIVTPFEVELAFNEARPFSPLCAIDFKQILPGGQKYNYFISNKESDVSLTKGTIRKFVENDVEPTNTINDHSFYSIVKNEIDLDSYKTEKWDGLPQETDESNIEKAIPGRSGIPDNYENEPT